MGEKMQTVVVIQNKNYAKFLPYTIESILKQKVPFDHIIGTDAGSSDESKQIYEKMLGEYTEIEESQAGVLNKVLVSVMGDYDEFLFSWINSDDMYMPNFVQSHLEYFKRNPDAEIVCSRAMYCVAETGKTWIHGIPDCTRNLEQGENWICQPTAMIKSSVFDKIGIFNSTIKYAFDFEFWLRAKKAGIKFGFIPDVTVFYRVHSHSLTALYHEDIMQETRGIVIRKSEKNSDYQKHSKG